MPTTPQPLAACCGYAYWDHVSDVAGGQLWVQDCPEHGHLVGSEYVLSYSLADAPSSEAIARAS